VLKGDVPSMRASRAGVDKPRRTSDIRDAVSPLWRVPYGEQLLKKFNKVSHALVLIRRKVSEMVV
jgi:hypothetical protein